MTDLEVLCALCPMTPDGRHKRKPWAGDGRSGFACCACHKTWEHAGSALVATYDLMRLRSLPDGPERQVREALVPLTGRAFGDLVVEAAVERVTQDPR